MARYALHLFGGFQLERDEQTVDVPPSSQRLLGFLALHDRALVRGYVAASLWPDTTDEKAGANLRTALWRLNRPELDLISTVHGQLALRADVWVDARVVRRASREHRLRRVLPAPDVLADIRGELLPGCWDSWLVFERERLRQEAVHLLEAACAASVAEGETERAVVYALAAVECDPLRETANLWVVRAHLAAGNRADAALHARRYEALLHDELGLAPPPLLDELLWARPLVAVTALPA
jgi:DNA-binding SARP family transcriptional activator